MGVGDKISNTAEEASGKGKQAVGDATDNEQMQAEGKGQETKADVKQGGEKAKDAWNDATNK
ncbi:MAG: CsbD family protein [Ornithinimicrobium sp.]